MFIHWGPVSKKGTGTAWLRGRERRIGERKTLWHGTMMGQRSEIATDHIGAKYVRLVITSFTKLSGIYEIKLLN